MAVGSFALVAIATFGALICLSTATPSQIPEKKSCQDRGSVCDEGLACIGPDHDKRCWTLMPEGKPCGKDPYWVCEDGLRCKNGICEKEPIAEKRSCQAAGSICAAGLSCIGPNNDKRCWTLMPEGKPCGKDPYWVCEDGLVCSSEICKRAPIPEKKSCQEPGSVCEKGLSCIGPNNDKRCWTLMPKGKPCGKDPYWVCEEGLVCDDGTCIDPPIDEKKSCQEPGSVCKPGLVCVGPPKEKKCWKPMGKGDSCGIDPYWVCKDGLKCTYSVCTA